MSSILIFMICFGIFFMIMYGMLFVFSPAVVVWLPFLIYWRIDVLLLTSFITYPPCVAIHQTITLQVYFQYSGIRLCHACWGTRSATLALKQKFLPRTTKITSTGEEQHD